MNIVDRYDISGKGKLTGAAAPRSTAKQGMVIAMEIERNPMSLSDEHLMAVMQQWRKLHSVGSRDKDSSPLQLSEKIDRAKEQAAVYREVLTDVGALLSADALAELKAIFSIGRNPEPLEAYPKIISDYRGEFAGVANLDSEIAQLLEKANFLTMVCEGLVRLGRDETAASLRHI